MEQNIADIRQLPEIKDIAAYMRDMQFKRKVFGGYDGESVLDHFSQVSERFEAIIAAYAVRSEANARQAFELQDALEQMKQANAAWEKYCRELIPWYEAKLAWLQAQNDRLQREIMGLWAQLEQRRWGNAPQQ